MIPTAFTSEIPDYLVELYGEAETEILCDMADRISQMDFYLPAVQWQEQMLQQMGLSHDYIVSTLSRLTGKTIEELEKLITEAGADVLKTNAYLADLGFNLQSVTASEVWKERLAAGLSKTGWLFENLTQTTASVGAAQFRRACDMAYMQIETGAFSPDQAIANAVRRLSKEGIRTVEYHGETQTTHTDNIDVAVRRAVVTGVNQTTAELNLAINEELGLDLVEVSAHEGARPEHAVWQGGIYSLSGTSTKYPDFRKTTGYGTGAGLCGWNCRHTFAPYVDGSPRVWPKDELDRLNNRTVTYNGEEMSYYDATQKQRYIERNIRRWKREVLACDSAGVPNGRAAERLSYWNHTQNDFLEQTGFKKQFDRTSVIGYNRSVSSAATNAAKAQRIVDAAKKKSGIRGSVRAITRKVTANGLSFDHTHINVERGHDVTEAEARSYIENAVAVIFRTKNGVKYANYFSPDGAAYVDIDGKVIRTAFKREQYDEKTIAFLQEVINGWNK